MRTICETDFHFTPQVTPHLPRRHFLSLIVKGTFRLVPGGIAQLADKQELPSGDVAYEDDAEGKGAPRYPIDLTPWKPRTDLIVAGACYPPGRPAARCPVAFEVADWRRELEVIGNRTWKYKLGVVPTLPEPEPFARMELRYENAYGGAGFKRNPIGKGFAKVEDESQQRVEPMPNIEDPLQPWKLLKNHPEPASFGAIPMTWPQRESKAGTYDERWVQTRFPGVPDDFDWSIFNAAPAPQQADGFLRGDENLCFSNLHPKHSEYRSRLPAVRARCFLNVTRDPSDLELNIPGVNAPPSESVRPAPLIEREKASFFYEVPMNLDTLWVDMEAEQLVLVWRGVTPVRSEDCTEVAHAYVLSELIHEGLSSLEAYRQKFDEQLAIADTPAGLVAQLPGGLGKGVDVPELPDVDEEIARVKKEMAAKMAGKVDGHDINQRLAEGLGDEAATFPSLAGLEIEQQVTAMDGFAKSTTKLVHDLAKQKQQLSQSGGGARASTDFSKLLKEAGVEQQLKQADRATREMALDWLRSKINLSAFGVDLAPMLMGLSGVDDQTRNLAADLGLDLGDGPPMTRADVERRVAAGESLEGEMLAELDLSGMDLRNADFRRAIFVKTSLVESDLSGADLREAVLVEADLTEARLVEAKLNDANLCGATLSRATFFQAVLDDAICGTASCDEVLMSEMSARGADFSGSDFSGGQLERSHFKGADFSQCKLDAASFRQSDLREAAFDEATGDGPRFVAADMTNVRASRGCKFAAAVFQQARMHRSNFSGAELPEADFSHATLDGAFLISAMLAGAKFTAASLAGARLDKAKLGGARLVQANLFQTMLGGADLTAANLDGAHAFNANFTNAILDDALLDRTNLSMAFLQKPET